MKQTNFILIILIALLLLVTTAVSVYYEDYFYNLKMKECAEYKQVEYQIPSDQISKCLDIEVNKFWNWTIEYYSVVIIIDFFLFVLFFVYFILFSMSRRLE